MKTNPEAAQYGLEIIFKRQWSQNGQFLLNENFIRCPTTIIYQKITNTYINNRQWGVSLFFKYAITA